MNCKNYNCKNEANNDFLCCSSECGFEYKDSMFKLDAVLKDRVEWNEIPWGIKHWSVGKYLYFEKLIKTQ